MHLASNVPGRAIMQFHDNDAFRIENKVVVLQPNKELLEFEMKNDTVLIPTKLNKKMAKDALAHVTTASYLYKERKYRMKNKK